MTNPTYMKTFVDLMRDYHAIKGVKSVILKWFLPQEIQECLVNVSQFMQKSNDMATEESDLVLHSALFRLCVVCANYIPSWERSLFSLTRWAMWVSHQLFPALTSFTLSNRVREYRYAKEFQSLHSLVISQIMTSFSPYPAFALWRDNMTGAQADIYTQLIDWIARLPNVPIEKLRAYLTEIMGTSDIERVALFLNQVPIHLQTPENLDQYFNHIEMFKAVAPACRSSVIFKKMKQEHLDKMFYICSKNINKEQCQAYLIEYLLPKTVLTTQALFKPVKERRGSIDSDLSSEEAARMVV